MVHIIWVLLSDNGSKKSDRIGSEEQQNTANRLSIHLTMVLYLVSQENGDISLGWDDPSDI